VSLANAAFTVFLEHPTTRAIILIGSAGNRRFVVQVDLQSELRPVRMGELAGDGMKPAANDVQTVVTPGAGHWVAEQAPEEMLAALTAFLAPYRNRPAAEQDPRPHAAAAF